MSKRALLVGCNYPGTDAELNGCVNDVMRIKKTLLTRFGFDERDIVVMIDTDKNYPQPTGANIRKGLSKIVEDTSSGDVLFMHYSGHGTRVPPESGQEDDTGYDECIVPTDMNLLSDNDFRDIVNKLPEGVTFTFVTDCCHSGGLLDHAIEQIGDSTKEGAKKSEEAEKKGSRGIASRDFHPGRVSEEVSSGGYGRFHESKEKERGWGRSHGDDDDDEDRERRYGGRKDDDDDDDEDRRERRNYGRKDSDDEERDRRHGRRHDEDEDEGRRYGRRHEEEEEEGGRRYGYGREERDEERKYGRKDDDDEGRYGRHDEEERERYGRRKNDNRDEEEGRFSDRPGGRREEREDDNRGSWFDKPEKKSANRYGIQLIKNDRFVTVKNRSITTDLLMGMLKSKFGLGGSVVSGGVRSALYNVFGEEASPMVQLFVGLAVSQLPNILQALASKDESGNIQKVLPLISGLLGQPAPKPKKESSSGGFFGFFGHHEEEKKPEETQQASDGSNPLEAIGSIVSQLSGSSGGSGAAAAVLGMLQGGGATGGGLTTLAQQVAAGGDQKQGYAGWKPGQGEQVREDMGVLVSGCQSDETSADANPDGNPEHAYGALSNAIQQVLEETDGPITSRQLVLEVRKKLKQTGFAQNPGLYCSNDNADAWFICGS